MNVFVCSLDYRTHIYPTGSFAQNRPPVFLGGTTYIQDLVENTLINTVVVSNGTGGLKDFTVTDADYDEIVFTLDNTTSSPNVPRFSLNRTTGALVVAQSLDVDSLGGVTDIIVFNITACDEDTPVATCPSIQVTINILATNDNSPQFSSDFYRVEAFTSTAVGTLLLTANCTDADVGVGEFAGIEFSSTSPPNNPQMYDLDEATGVLTLLQMFDNIGIQTFSLRCFDGPPGASEDTVVVVIEVARNDPPVFAAVRYHTTVTEDFEVGSVIAQLSCTDNEKELDGYELFNPSTVVEETFALSNTGALTSRKSFDICEQTRYEFQVVCLDNVNQMAYTTVEINVQGGTIYFENCSYTFDFDRLTMPNNGEEIGRVRAIGRGVVEYSLDNNQFFGINSSGRIFPTNYILISQGNTINLQVQARVGQAKDTANVTINILGPLSFLEVSITAAVSAALIIVLLICILIACFCCCFRQHKTKV